VIIGYIVIAFAISAIVLFVWKAISRATSGYAEIDLSQQVKTVDLEAFRNLTDTAEEQFLRERLEPAAFRTIQRERLRTAIEYVGGVSHNAAVLLSLGQTARQNPDPLISEAGRNLVDEALRLRLYSTLTISKLWMRYLFPDTEFQPSGIVDRYQHVTEGAVRLGRLQYPERGGLLSRAL
jgi:hypothetical protein